MPGLNMGIIKSITLPIPPIHLQMTFVRKMAAWKRVREYYNSQSELLNVLFASLQQRAFRGELTSKVAERELAEAS